MHIEDGTLFHTFCPFSSIIHSLCFSEIILENEACIGRTLITLNLHLVFTISVQYVCYIQYTRHRQYDTICTGDDGVSKTNEQPQSEKTIQNINLFM